MQNGEELRQKATMGVEKRHVAKTYHFQKGEVINIVCFQTEI
jgi:hypothetical protein